MANRLVVEKLGGFCSFFNGACGNINPELGERNFERAEHYGAWIADELVQAVSLTSTTNRCCIGSAQASIDIPLTLKREKMILPEDRNEIMDYFRGIESRHLPLNERAYAGKWELYQRLRTSWWRHKLVEEFGNSDSEQVCVQAHRILDHLILTAPGEIFVEFQLKLQKAFANNRVMIFGYANGYCGYVPDAESFEVDSYETNPSFMHRVGQYAGEKITEAGRTLLNDLLRVHEGET